MVEHAPRSGTPMRDRLAGMVADGTFQIGARRTYRSNGARAWGLLGSPAGAEAWLGARPQGEWFSAHGGPARGEVIELVNGDRFEVRSQSPGTRIRLRALGPGTVPGSTVQLTVTGERGRTVVGLHQEGMPDEAMREPARQRWQLALDRIGELLDG